MQPSFNPSLAGYTLLSVWMGALLFHIGVVVPVAFKVMERGKLGEFSLSVQERFQTFGLLLTSLATVLLIWGGAYTGAILSSTVLLSLLFSVYLRGKIRRALKRFQKERSETAKMEIFNGYRLVAYAVYTQALAGLAAILIGWLGL